MSGDTKTVYLVKNHYSQCGGLTEEIVGIYSDKESAIKVAKKEWNKYGKWQRRLAVPHTLYLNHIDDFEKKHSEDDEHIWWHDFHDYLGYTGQEWQSTEDTIRAACDDYRQTNVLERNLDEKGIPPKTIWEKKWKETELIPCRENDKWGLRDEATNKFVVPPTYADCIQFQCKTVHWDQSVNGLYQISEKPRNVDYWGIKSADNGKWGVVNKGDKLIIPAEYDEICNVMFEGSISLHFFKVSKNGKYGLLNNHGEVILPVEYDDLHDHIERKSGIIYASAQRNGKQEHYIINEYRTCIINRYRTSYPEDRQKLLDSWFEWTEEAIQAVARLNRALIEAEKNVREEYNARKAELKSQLITNNRLLTDYEIDKALKLSILVEDENGELTEPTEGIYAALNEILSTASTGFIIDSEKDWGITLGKDVAIHLWKEISDEFSPYCFIHYGIHVLRNQLLFAWEDILKIRSVQAEVRVDYQKGINIIPPNGFEDQQTINENLEKK
ncbi:MAG: WG repeat-containing protein [Prevotellaceae bacterium]|jgi:hypothetical protein|nr:WG repeat-containing protein [Prevotellaceae bacterium]